MECFLVYDVNVKSTALVKIAAALWLTHVSRLTFHVVAHKAFS